MKRFMPRAFRLYLRLLLRRISDIQKGIAPDFAKPKTGRMDLPASIRITQDLRPNEAKLENLRLAQSAIDSAVVMPGEIFSFWALVGAPTKRRGFRESRSIQGNNIENSVGGGLCQLSGLIYYISLVAGLEIIERHQHSMDIYDETTRFAPLGSDATVVYGYKDLRVRNCLNSPIQFTFQFGENNWVSCSTQGTQSGKRWWNLNTECWIREKWRCARYKTVSL